jgi:hypothetical protein
MRKPLNCCPICGGQLKPIKLKCDLCDLALEGNVPTSKLSLLSSEQQRFAEAFLVARGNIKNVEKELNISYPTVRKKLNEVIEALGYAPQEELMKRSEILDAIERGEISAREGAELLRKQL